jgi:hypothetical protein
MREDLAKSRAIAVASTEIFLLLLATHPCTEVPANLAHVVKYRTAINTNLSRFRHVGVSTAAKKAVASWRLLGRRGRGGHFSAGEAFGVPVTVHYWLFGPFAA